MKEIIINNTKTELAPLYIKGVWAERVKFLVVLIFEDLSWSSNTSAIAKKKAQQWLHFLRVL